MLGRPHISSPLLWSHDESVLALGVLNLRIGVMKQSQSSTTHQKPSQEIRLEEGSLRERERPVEMSNRGIGWAWASVQEKRNRGRSSLSVKQTLQRTPCQILK